MKKSLLLSAFLLPLLGGCDVLSPQSSDLDKVVEHGSAVLSGAWDTAKTVGQEYYNDQVKPKLDTVINQAKDQADQLTQQAKNQVNSGIDQVGQEFSDRMQEKADTIRDEIESLKVK
ncbi:MAG: hypothetical protein LBU27_06070 [Candidatus Peribacteria bacterium]|nr:hypothetical protein [Candidatus Peribacteria bacterium]